MGDRYISQNALISEIAKIKGNLNTRNVGQAIWDTPTADVVEVRHGHWIEHIEKPSWLEDDVEVYYNCSECGTSHWSIMPPYCPECGAKMDGERSENGKS